MASDPRFHHQDSRTSDLSWPFIDTGHANTLPSSSSGIMNDSSAKPSICLYDHDHDHDHDNDNDLESTKGRRQAAHSVTNEKHNEIIAVPSNTRHAEHAVAPFLAKHIPVQYNPLGGPARLDEKDNESASNTKYCYRHRPDLKCRRQANEPSMDQLQKELGQLSQSDQQAISHVWSLFSASPSKHRNMMLQGILTQCCFPQLSFISSQVRDLIKIDFLSALPNELGYKVLCFLDTTSLCKAAQVSRSWRTLADDDVVWHRMCEQHIDRKCTKCGWGLPLLERKRLRTEKRQIQLRARGRGLNEWSPDITPVPESALPSLSHPLDSVLGVKRAAEDQHAGHSTVKRLRGDEDDEAHSQPRLRPWKDVYKDRFKVGTNWKYGRCTTRTFKGHTNGIMCLQFDDNILATGSYDATIKIWDIESGEELRTLRGHTSGIRCLQFDDTKLMSGSMDKTIKVWNWRTGECLRTFRAHNGGVVALHFDSNFLVSGSMDHSIRVYDLRSIKCTFLLRGHTDWVNSVRIDSASRTLLSSSDDCTVRLWDLDTKQCIKAFEGHVGQVQEVLFLPHQFDIDEADLLNGDANKDDDDQSSNGSRSPQPLLHSGSHNHHDAPAHPHNHPPSSFDNNATQPFWPEDTDRPAPPRYFLTGALDSTIRLWDIFTPATVPTTTTMTTSTPPHDSPPPSTSSCLRTFFGHVEGIWALAADHLRLVSGSEDRMVKIWDPRSGKCERTFTGHAGPVTCVGLSDSRLVTGSEDCEVRMLIFGDEAPKAERACEGAPASATAGAAAVLTGDIVPTTE